MSWALPLAQLIRAGIAADRGDPGTARDLLRAAEAGFRDAGMGLFAAAACRRQGELLAGDAGHALVARANAWMEGQGIKNPSRMTALYAPGFADS